jgi:hypothetical protein
MSRRSPATRSLLLVVAFALSWIGCTIDDPQVSSVAAVSLLTVDPVIVPQAVVLAPAGTVTLNRVQTMQWTITRADLTVPGVPDVYDLLFTPEMMSPDCQAIDSPSRLTVNFGTCLANLVVEATPEAAGIQAELELEFTVQLKRVEPVILPYFEDEDMDGILNGNDNCILVPNNDQTDTANTGLGDVCRVIDFFNGVQLDSDGDGIPDSADNCVHVANLDQANPASPGEFSMLESSVSDGIGLACENDAQLDLNPTRFGEQIITLGSEMNPQSVTLNFDFILPNAQGFVVVDFNDELVFPDCEWDMGTCSGFDPSMIQVCIRTSVFDLLNGCS